MWNLCATSGKLYDASCTTCDIARANHKQPYTLYNLSASPYKLRPTICNIVQPVCNFHANVVQPLGKHVSHVQISCNPLCHLVQPCVASVVQPVYNLPATFVKPRVTISCTTFHLYNNLCKSMCDMCANPEEHFCASLCKELCNHM